MNPVTQVVALFCVYAFGALIGILAGVHIGKARGWCERHFEQIEKENARRDARGRFKTKETRQL